jgi:hypothetical protein
MPLLVVLPDWISPDSQAATTVYARSRRAQHGQDARHVGLYRRLGHDERIGDLGIGYAAQSQAPDCPGVPMTDRAKIPVGR